MTNYLSKFIANSTTYNIGGDILDSQWIGKYYGILEGVSLGGGTYHTYSLSSYLPSDSYNYEVIFYGTSGSGAKSGNVCQLTLFPGTTSSETQGWRLGRCQARTAYAVAAGGSAIIPITSSDRNITVFTQDATTNNTGTYLRATGYRRIGTNGYSNTTAGKIIYGSTTYTIGGNIANSNVVMFTSQRSGLINTETEKNLLFNDVSFSASGGIASSPYSVANCIPNDGYDYELCLSFWTAVSTKDKYSQIILYSGSTADDNNFTQIVGRRTARTNANYQTFCTIWIPIKSTNKYIYLKNTGNVVTKVNCMVHGYRRIGTNSYNTSTGSYGSNIVKVLNDHLLGGYNFDGPWTISRHTCADAVTYSKNSATTYSLASYLPNDGYNYMVMFSGYGRTQSGSGSAVYRIASGTKNYDNTYAYGPRFMMTEYHSTSTYACSGNLMIPIFSNDRNVTIANTAAYVTSNSGLYAIAYRRLGSNT